jgi:hypothetical protein
MAKKDFKQIQLYVMLIPLIITNFINQLQTFHVFRKVHTLLSSEY